MDLSGFSNIFDALPGCIFLKDENFQFIGCNKSFATFLGFSVEEIIGKKDVDVTTAEHAKKIRQLDEKVLLSKKGATIEELVKINGREIPILTQKVPFEYKKGKFGILGTFLIEDEIVEYVGKDSDPEYILDQLPEVFICWKDEESVFKGCNQAFANLVGKDKLEIIGRKDTCEKHVKDDAEVRVTKKAKIHMRETIPRENGKNIEIMTNKGPWVNKGGKVVGTVVSFTKCA